VVAFAGDAIICVFNDDKTTPEHLKNGPFSAHKALQCSNVLKVKDLWGLLY
jgi:hypothetical protein